jgi:hypothetical protein
MITSSNSPKVTVNQTPQFCANSHTAFLSQQAFTPEWLKWVNLRSDLKRWRMRSEVNLESRLKRLEEVVMQNQPTDENPRAFPPFYGRNLEYLELKRSRVHPFRASRNGQNLYRIQQTA